MVWAIVVFGAVSALAWLVSALVTPVLTATYWDGPPAHLVQRMKLGSGLNAIGALCASAAIGLQTWQIYATATA